MTKIDFEPTAEQVEALDKFTTGGSLIIQARAGAGKTSTLRLLASSTGRQGQYLAFNRAIVEDAKESMPRNIAASTIHSLAFRSYGYKFKSRINSKRVPSEELARKLGIDPIVIGYPGGEDKRLAPGFLAGHVTKAVERFCQSADPEPSVYHFAPIDGIDDLDKDGKRTYANSNRVARELMPYVERLWVDLQDPAGTMPYGHHAYLKAWQLTDPQIPADFVLLDEAQDVAPVMNAIFQAQQTAQLIAVGDDAQEIYGFTGAINAMATMDADAEAVLSQSFRFGPAIAEIANAILMRLDTSPLVGTKTIDSVVGPVAEPDCVLTRTNATAVREVMFAQQDGRRPHLMGGGYEVVRFAKSARDLMNGRRVDHPDLGCFGSWGEVLAYVNNDPQGDDLRLMVNLIDEFGVETIIDALDNMVSEAAADVVISTAHKAKGREWRSVRLTADFNRADRATGTIIPPSAEELRLLYVAATRAQLELDIDSVRILSVAEAPDDEKCCPICERTDVVRSNGLIGAHRDCGPTGFDIMAVTS